MDVLLWKSSTPDRKKITGFYYSLGGVKQKKTTMQKITIPTASDTTRAQPRNFLIHLNVTTSRALPPCGSLQAAKRPVVSHLFTPAAAGCHWESEGEIPWFSLPFLTASVQTTLIRDCGWFRGSAVGMDGSGPGRLNRGRRSVPGDKLDVKHSRVKMLSVPFIRSELIMWPVSPWRTLDFLVDWKHSAGNEQKSHWL